MVAVLGSGVFCDLGVVAEGLETGGDLRVEGREMGLLDNWGKVWAGEVMVVLCVAVAVVNLLQRAYPASVSENLE